MSRYEFEVDVTKRRKIIVEEENSEDAIEKVASMLDDMKAEVRNLVHADIHNYRLIKD
jgi:mevalonate pyrophosphate decarboxylase